MMFFSAGFTFSFPMVQHSLTSALLLTWTKKFSCSDTVMKDVVQMLEEAIQRRGVRGAVFQLQMTTVHLALSYEHV